MSGEGFSKEWDDSIPLHAEKVWTPDGYYDEDGYWVDAPGLPPITRSERIVYRPEP